MHVVSRSINPSLPVGSSSCAATPAHLCAVGKSHRRARNEKARSTLLLTRRFSSHLYDDVRSGSTVLPIYDTRVWVAVKLCLSV